MSNYGIHWFRRDLRIYGNSALEHNLAVNHGRVLGLFCFDRQFLERKDFSWNRFAFFLATLEELQKDLASSGGELLLVDQSPLRWWAEYLQLCRQENIAIPSLITWSRDYEPFARWRDDECCQLLKSAQIPIHHQRDHLLIEPHELTKKTGDAAYQVFTPFARRWLELMQTTSFQQRAEQQKTGLEQLFNLTPKKKFTLTWQEHFGRSAVHLPVGILPMYQEQAKKNLTIALPDTGKKAVIKILRNFENKISSYDQFRDFPHAGANSGLSVYFKNGQLTVPMVVQYFKLLHQGPAPQFLTELIWREFYYHVLWHQPQVEHREFLAKFRSINWPNNPQFFSAWKEGLTGFPIVDAGMRQLKTTGLLHNRVRMIVASFLVKDLLIDWRWGERYFMEKLLDGDLAANNGGWQWCASTGTDPQPYFRIFNPWTQGKKFDPDGHYITTYLPELHASWKAGELDIHRPIYRHATYPTPIVDHGEQRIKALELYRHS